MTEIRVYQTHVEVSPYKKGDWPELEKFYSIYVHSGRRAFYKPFCYEIRDNVLFLPKGINILTLEQKFGVNATYERMSLKSSYMREVYKIVTPPRNPDLEGINISQQDAIEFMAGTGKFAYTSRLTQLVLQLPTGFGKTYCCISAIVSLKVKALVMLHRDDLMNQWADQIIEHSTIPKERIILVRGSKIMEDIIDGKEEGDVYLVMHQTISAAQRTHGISFVKNFFSATKVGLKIVDETHEYLQSTVRVDFAVNVAKNIYVSGTFSRSRYRERRIMQSIFSSAAFYGDATPKISVSDRHVIYCPVEYKSSLESQYIIAMKNAYGFSPTKFINFSLDFDPKQSLLHAVFSIIDKHVIEEPEKYPGRILLVSASRYSVEYFYNALSSRYAGKVTVGKKYSDTDKDERAVARKQHIICSTLKSSGTGFDEPIQTVICAEPHSSTLLTTQLKGRLDRYIPGKMTYFYDLIDKSIPYFEDIQKLHMKVMRDYARDIVPLFL